jgi:hypothetical protein
MTSEAAVRVQPVRAVLDADGQVVVMFAGADADEAAQDWADRGYRVEPAASVAIAARDQLPG